MCRPRFSGRTVAIHVTLVCVAVFVVRDMGGTAVGMLFGSAVGQWFARAAVRPWSTTITVIGMVVGVLIGAVADSAAHS